jgi:phenylalanyl-tRNA synthetase beta chain
MRVPLSWVRDYVAITDTPESLASRLTFAGLEVEDLEYVGLAPADAPIAGVPAAGRRGQMAKGLAWDPSKIVIAQIVEVLPHPNADRLTLLRVDDGSGEELIVLTGAPNLFHLKGTGPLPTPLKVVYAREGSVLYDGHKPGREIMTLKRAKIRGVESKSMVCSEKELGISDEHDGIIILDDDAPVGAAAADYMGDVVLEVKINPNMARNACVLGIAREVAALTGQTLRAPCLEAQAHGAPIDGRVGIEIREPRLNSRFVLGLIEGVTIRPSPYQVQRRLRLMGTRPISNIVDATNYAMFELGEPLHAFDWDVIQRRAQGKRPTIITRLPEPGETLRTLDGVDRTLEGETVLVCDEHGALSLAGVMGGAQSEVAETTVNVLLEGASWEFINIRRTTKAHNLPSEASYRFSRGVHPALAERGVLRALELMRLWAGGTVARGLIDSYPGRPAPATIEITTSFVERQLGVALSADQIVGILRSLEFVCDVRPQADAQASDVTVRVTAPDHRLDIGTGVIGQADVLEEIARIYGYERIPETMLAEVLPPQHINRTLVQEERVRDLLVSLGLQEIVTYSLTSPEREARMVVGPPPEATPEYVRLVNPIVVDRVVMRHALLPGLLDIASANARHADRLAMFELGSVYLPVAGAELPDEPVRLALVLAGPRSPSGWQPADREPMDFFDLKGMVEALIHAMHLRDVAFVAGEHASLTPGRSAQVTISGQAAGWLGELHPAVAAQFDLTSRVLVAELDLAAMTTSASDRHPVSSVQSYPPIKEDLAVIVDDGVPAAQVADVIRRAGGALLGSVSLFDLYRGDQVGAGKKSLAFSVTYQAPDRTLTDVEAGKLRDKIVRGLADEIGAVLRG